MDQVVPLGEVIVPDDRCSVSDTPVEDLNVSVRFAEIVVPQTLRSDNCHVHAGYASFTGAAVGVNHPVSLALACTVWFPVAHLAAGGASEWFGISAYVVTDGFSQVGPQNGIVCHLQYRSKY